MYQPIDKSTNQSTNQSGYACVHHLCMCVCVCVCVVYVLQWCMYHLLPLPKKKHSHQQRKRLNIEYRLSITITFIIRVPPWVLLDYAYCGIMVNNENGRRFVNGESTDMDIVWGISSVRAFSFFSCLFFIFFKNSTLICCAVDIPKYGSVQYFFFFLRFSFLLFFLPPLFRPWVVYSWRTLEWDNRQQDRVSCMAIHSQKR